MEDLSINSPPNPEEDHGNHDPRGVDKDLKEVVNILIPDHSGKDTENACQSIYLLHNVRKIKMLKKLKFKLGKLSALW